MHLAAGIKEWRTDRNGLWTGSGDVDWIYATKVAEMEDGRAKILCLDSGEKIALWRNGNEISATSNLCAHQHGPLGEGCIIDGSITCPWHGFQYNPTNGQSPPPYHEKITTYAVRIEEGDVYIDPKPFPPGTEQTPALIDPNLPPASSQTLDVEAGDAEAGDAEAGVEEPGKK